MPNRAKKRLLYRTADFYGITQKTLRFLCLILIFMPICNTGQVQSYETDQYSNRLVPIKDSLAIMDARVNQTIATVAREWRGARNDQKFARKVYKRLGGLHWVDKIERYAMKSKKIEKLPQHRRQSIFSGFPVWATRVNFFFGVGRTIRVADVLIGSDKFGHFFSQGLKYYRRRQNNWDIERVMNRGAYTERWIFGYLTTGIYSNADLVANYEGMLFYEGLFNDGVVAKKKAIIRWGAQGPVIQREFTWADHITDYWDEALNPSAWTPSIKKRIIPKIKRLCPEYRKDPSLFRVEKDKALWDRYAFIGLKDARANRVDQICACAESGQITPDG